MIQDLKTSFTTHADRNAFCIDDRHFTYRQFSALVRDIQLKIARQGGSKTKRIGIITTDSIETYASIFACWFSGYAYVPLHPKNPDERSRTILKEANVDLILSAETEQRYFADAAPAPDATPAPDLDTALDPAPAPAPAPALTVVPTHIPSASAELEAVPSFQEPAAGDLLYILFTSGSTGIPKGVPITYGNLNAFVDSYQALDFSCDASDRFLQMFDLTFDVSVASYLIPLLLGACVYTVPAEGIKYMNVYKLMQKHQISFASIVPSIINYLKPYFGEIKLPSLKYCILTAEASNLKVVSEWADCMPNGQIVNLYGPTEATIWCTGYVFQPGNPKAYNEMLVIGKPFKNVDILILNEEGGEVAPGEKGELHVSSRQVTPGYVNNEEKNRTAFLTRDGRRFYKTGDLCYLDAEKDIFYCGRADHQVKIQGFRIELSEIEVAVRELFSLNTAAVVYKNALGVQQIGLFIEKYPGEIASIKSSLEKKLPYYMIPSVIQVIDNLPYNTSGKIDRVNLVKLFG